MTKPKMEINVWSDSMCPFCYLGKRNFEAAMLEFEYSSNIELVWHSFILNPEFPPIQKEAISYYQYIADLKGISINKAKLLFNDIVENAGKAGLKYNIDMAIMFNSLNVHKILQKAKSKGLSDEAEERFFYAFFSEGKNLNDIQTLIALSEEIGLTIIETNEALTNDIYSYLVSQDIQEAANLGIDTVPTFIFNDKYSLIGAQSPALFLELLRKSYSEYSNHSY